MTSGYLYILRCKDGSYYVGHTSDPDYRVPQHNAGFGGDYTSKRLPVTLVYGEEFPTVYDAFVAERQVKGWSRAKKEALIRRDYDALPELSWSTTKRAAHVLRQAQDGIAAAVDQDGPVDNAGVRS